MATCWCAARSGSRINSGREFVRVEGIVRPSDIAPDNSVVSWKVADAYHPMAARARWPMPASRLAVPLLQFAAHPVLNCPFTRTRSTCPHVLRPTGSAPAVSAGAAAQAERVKDLASVQACAPTSSWATDWCGPRRHRRPDQPDAVHAPEHQEHADPLTASPFRRTPIRSSRTWPR
jgi:hypothetical protein